jgi:hypothetical protein
MRAQAGRDRECAVLYAAPEFAKPVLRVQLAQEAARQA